MTDLSFIKDLGPQGGLVVGIWFVMMFIKPIPFLKTRKWMLPCIACSIGMVVFPFIADPGQVTYTMRSPTVGMALHGLLIGGFAAMSNNSFQLFLKQRGLSASGDTEIIEKPDSNKAP